ncbi:MAG: S-adenosylmethionine:tRNA ribosyltransferase-isomerase [Flammeovirgaceae bacterium]
MIPITTPVIEFDLPKELACPPPTEARGIARDQVNLLVTAQNGVHIRHSRFDQLDRWLTAGDVLVVNTSATQAAALPIRLPNQQEGRLHLSTQLTGQRWLAEIRAIEGTKTKRWKKGEVDMQLSLPEGSSITLTKRYYNNRDLLNLWVIELHLAVPLVQYLNQHGLAIKYDGIDKPYPLSYYQTYFSFHPGSAEMPSASRGFTPSLVNRLLKKGVVFAPILLHTGVSSLEENEKPYAEYMEVNPISAALMNQAKADEKRVIAIGTTAIRAIESAVDHTGQVRAFRGHTELFIDSNYSLQVADGLLTGFHEPKASHLHILQAIAGYAHLEKAYEAALQQGYYWHEFGDLHLILP